MMNRQAFEAIPGTAQVPPADNTPFDGLFITRKGSSMMINRSSESWNIGKRQSQMAETYNRSAGDQAGYGYRQLPAGGATWGPDLKTIVYAGVGVFFGILAGTTIADGSWRSLNPMALGHTAQVDSIHSGSANRAVAKSAQTPPLQAQALRQGIPQPTAALQSTTARPTVAQPTAAKPTAPLSTTAQSTVTQPTAAKPTAAQSTTAQSTVAPQIPVTHKLYVAQQVSGAQRAHAIHRHRLVHKVAVRKKHFGRRRVHIRHRLRAVPKTVADAKLPSNVTALDSSDAVELPASIPSAFTVYGEVTVFSYDSTAGIIETYEGETFALDKTQSASGALPWDEYVPDIHYGCDQFGNCTLNPGGGVVLNAKRTK
jgi:hypothetical protein